MMKTYEGKDLACYKMKCCGAADFEEQDLIYVDISLLLIKIFNICGE